MWYVIQPDRCQRLTDDLTLMQSLASLIHEMNISDWKKSSITATMSATLSRIHEGPFMTHTADELIFKGWSLEPYTKIIETLNSTIFKGGIPALPEDLRFGFYFGVINVLSHLSLSHRYFSEFNILFFLNIEKWN